MTKHLGKGLHPAVLIVGRGYMEAEIFRDRGFAAGHWHPDVFDTIHPEDHKNIAVVWTGGQDINPALYNQKPLKGIHWTDARDRFEVDAFKRLPDGVPKIGICRGGQLLNALSGGSMFQHVNNHIGTHPLRDVETNLMFKTTSVHHQMMIPTNEARVLAKAPGLSTLRLRENQADHGWYEDPEVVFYPKTQSFCFQGHPEYGDAACTEYFFQLLARTFEQFAFAAK